MARIVDKGRDNVVTGDRSAAKDLVVQFIGNGNSIHIGEGCTLHGLVKFHRNRGAVRFDGGNRGEIFLHLKGNDCRFSMGSRTACNSKLWINLAGDECSIEIGEDCLFAGVRMRPSDSHKIFDADGKRINEPKPIRVGNSVWLAEDTLLLGGADIGAGSVVGARSLVNGVIPEKCLAVGSPARVVKEGIRWEP